MNVTCSVVIITKNREYDLLECLASIFAQSVAPSEIVIVDNGSTDNTVERVRRLARASKIPIRVLSESKAGYPVLRQRGFAAAKYEWIVSIDDDCVADRNWLESFVKAAKLKPQRAAFLGASFSYDLSNPFSLSTQLFENMWKLNSIHKNQVMNCDILDTKNSGFNSKFLRDQRIKFDTNRQEHFGAAEDSDLGLQIQAAGGQIGYVPTMKVWHKNPTSFSGYFSKLLLRYESRRVLDSKWDNSNGSYVPKVRERFFKNFLKIRRENKLSLLQTVMLFVVSLLSIVFSKLYWQYPRVFGLLSKVYPYV